MSTFLVTGGAGYIGSAVVRSLIESGHRVVVIDDLSTGKRAWIHPQATFVEGSICNDQDLERVFSLCRVDAVFHFAAKLLVEESVKQPVLYYETNVRGGIQLLAMMQKHSVHQMIFSSTAAVYGNTTDTVVTEQTETRPVNPYGWSKLMYERMLNDVSNSTQLRYVTLRYFNVTDVNPTHLIPAMVLTALGKRTQMQVFGTDYHTADGSAVRDYIHIDDLVDAHLRAYQHLASGGGNEIFNVGTGKGYTVLEMVAAAKRVTGIDFPVVVAGRRPGDPETIVASYGHIQSLLGWNPTYTIEDCIHKVWEAMRATN